MRESNKHTGVVNCLRLHVFEKPDVNSEIVCKVRYLCEVLIDLEESTDDFYKIYTVIGAEGFGKKEHISLRN